MPVMQDDYVSEYGWVMIPPAGWEKLPNSDAPVLAVHRPIVFSSLDDPDLSMTWMVAGHAVKEAAAQRFKDVTGNPDATAEDLIAIAPAIFPMIGRADSCEVVILADGSRAIEVIESYGQDDTGEGSNGYQLMWPLRGAGVDQVFQKLCFYAPADKFAENLPQVRQAARSFYYTRPFGWSPPEPEGL